MPFWTLGNRMRIPRCRCSQRQAQASSTSNTADATRAATPRKPASTLHPRSRSDVIAGPRHTFRPTFRHQPHRRCRQRQASTLSLLRRRRCTLCPWPLPRSTARRPCRLELSLHQSSLHISHRWNRARARLSCPTAASRASTDFCRSLHRLLPTLAHIRAPTTAARSGSRHRRSSRSTSARVIAAPILDPA